MDPSLILGMQKVLESLKTASFELLSIRMQVPMTSELKQDINHLSMMVDNLGLITDYHIRNLSQPNKGDKK